MCDLFFLILLGYSSDARTSAEEFADRETQSKAGVRPNSRSVVQIQSPISQTSVTIQAQLVKKSGMKDE